MGKLSEQNRALVERKELFQQGDGGSWRDFVGGQRARFDICAETMNRLLDAARSEGPSPEAPITDVWVMEAVEKGRRSEAVDRAEFAAAYAYELGWRDGNRAALTFTASLSDASPKPAEGQK